MPGAMPIGSLLRVFVIAAIVLVVFVVSLILLFQMLPWWVVALFVLFWISCGALCVWLFLRKPEEQ